MKLASKTAVLLLILGALTSARGQCLEATIPVGDTPYGLMWSPLGNKVYVANSQDGTVSVIDGATNVVIATIPVEDYPDMFALNTVDGKVYCPSGSEDRLNVICAYGDTLIRKVRLSGYPSFPAYNERRNKLYLSGTDEDRVYTLDGHTDTVVRQVSVRFPMWLALQPETDRLLVASNMDSDTVVVVDCSVDSVTVRQPLPRAQSGRPCVGLDGKIYVPCESMVEVYSPDCEEHLASIGTPAYAPWSSAYCPVGAKLYVGDFGGFVRSGVTVIDCYSHAVVRRIAASAQVYDLLCDTVRGRLYALADGTVQVFDSRNDSLRATVQLPAYSESATWNPVNRRLYASAPVANAVFVIRDTTTAVSEEAEVAVVRRAGGRVVRGRFTLAGPGRARLLSAAGRVAAALVSGPNDVGRLPPGVYFVRQDGDARARRIVLVR